jgi:hypothetical protein
MKIDTISVVTMAGIAITAAIDATAIMTTTTMIMTTAATIEPA